MAAPARGRAWQAANPTCRAVRLRAGFAPAQDVAGRAPFYCLGARPRHRPCRVLRRTR